ncbi:hypothetical protein [Limimaricola cinnabarinus]
MRAGSRNRMSRAGRAYVVAHDPDACTPVTAETTTRGLPPAVGV